MEKRLHSNLRVVLAVSSIPNVGTNFHFVTLYCFAWQIDLAHTNEINHDTHVHMARTLFSYCAIFYDLFTRTLITCQQ